MCAIWVTVYVSIHSIHQYTHAPALYTPKLLNIPHNRMHGGYDINLDPLCFYSLSDKDISVHLILLQLRTVQSCWRALGEAAGLERETVDMVGVTL